MLNKPSKIICMIPARLGSQRVKLKNLRLINGKPLIQYVIDKVKKCNLFDDIYINSESEVFRDIANKNSIILMLQYLISYRVCLEQNLLLLKYSHHY